MHGHVSWLVELDIKDGKHDAANDLILDLVEHSAKEPTTITYDSYITADKQHVAIYERYDSADSAHSHLKGFLENFVDRFVDVFDATRLVVYGSPHEDLRADLEGWQPVYMEHWAGFRR